MLKDSQGSSMIDFSRYLSNQHRVTEEKRIFHL